MYKRIKKFLEALPLIFEYANKVWNMINEIVTYQEELQQEKENLGN